MFAVPDLPPHEGALEVLPRVNRWLDQAPERAAQNQAEHTQTLASTLEVVKGKYARKPFGNLKSGLVLAGVILGGVIGSRVLPRGKNGALSIGGVFLGLIIGPIVTVLIIELVDLVTRFQRRHQEKEDAKERSASREDIERRYRGDSARSWDVDR